MAVSGEIRTEASLWDRIAGAYALIASAAELDARLEGVPVHRRHEVAAAWVEGATRS